jgi:hypothetical protein
MRFIILVLMLFSGCHGQWVKKDADFNLGLTRTEYRDGYVKYRRVSPQLMWILAKEKDENRRYQLMMEE